MELLDGLNPEQREAVETLEGPLLVVAGAGSGKTRVVTLRIINLLHHGIAPHQILGLTFTNKAAGEMRERVTKLTQNHVLICTFHSLGARILRESIEHLGYRSHFNIYDEEDVDKVLQILVVELDIKEGKTELKNFRQHISHAKNQMLMPSELNPKQYPAPFPDLYARYLAKLKEYNALDFDDLLFLTVRLFREHPQVLERYQNRWSHLLVDEYQDTNTAQYQMVHCLVAKNQNLCVVGDPDQSIYSWRGANIRNILNFEQDYPGARIIRLEQNYRSQGNILEAANAVIGHNSNRYHKKLWSQLGEGELLKLYPADNERREAEFVADRMGEYHHENQLPYREMVIFYRTNSQSRVLEDCLRHRHIPYVIVGGISFYQRREVKDILAFLRMVQDSTDFVSFARTINLPKRGLGESTLDKLRHGATLSHRSILAYCETLLSGQEVEIPLKLSQKQRQGLEEYLRIIGHLRQMRFSCSLKDLVVATIEQTGYLDYLKIDEETYSDRKENLDALIAKALEWEMSTESPTLTQFLEELSLYSTLDETLAEKDHVSLMTIHHGKGLEYTLTFLVGLEEHLFPHVNAKTEDQLEEERRLFYVGMTRAKKYLYLSFARERTIWGARRAQYPSRFLKEIPFEYITKIPQHSLPKPTLKTFEEVKSYSEAFQPGDVIFHTEFGVGIIRNLYEGSAGLTYKIFFSKDNREKSIVAKYAALQKV
jgi:DNA helicase-2/ATP-dependent DNA helicase PcrA